MSTNSTKFYNTLHNFTKLHKTLQKRYNTWERLYKTIHNISVIQHATALYETLQKKLYTFFNTVQNPHNFKQTMYNTWQRFTKLYNTFPNASRNLTKNTNFTTLKHIVHISTELYTSSHNFTRLFFYKKSKSNTLQHFYTTSHTCTQFL